MYNPFHPDPAPPGFGQNDTVPERQASFFSRLIFAWLDPILSVGFSRPLQKEDLWQLPPDRLTQSLSEVIERNFYKRCPPEKRPAFLREKEDIEIEEVEEKRQETDSTIKADSQSAHSQRKGKRKKYDESMLKALNQTFLRRFWFAGFIRLIADTLNTTTPLVTKLLLTWLTNSYTWHRTSVEEREALGLVEPQGVGYGIGLGIGIFAMQETASLLTTHYQLITMTTGLSVRTGLIGAIFRKALRLSGRARLEHGTGQITTMISTDATRLDRMSQFAHLLWISPIQIAIGIGLLIGNLGYSALVGFGLFVFSFPVQLFLSKTMLMQRKKGVVITDQRVGLITEVLQGIRLIKYYAWEMFYVERISKLREREIKTITRASLARSNIISILTAAPVIAAVLSFITYALSGHDLNVAIIFSSLQYFNVIRLPLSFLPLVLASAADAVVALQRISKYLVAEELSEPYVLDPTSEWAIDVEGDFAWETARAPTAPGKKQKTNKEKKDEKKSVLPTVASDQEKRTSVEEKPFELNNLKFKVRKGAFVAIVGSVGSGKSSLLQALIGEMRRVRGTSTFSSSVAYAPQSSWIMNTTLRQNVIFGGEDNEEKFREIIRACCLEQDLKVLPNGEETEIGEKGINLSGGQKARVSLARAAYSNGDIILMDDSLSAVDAFVGRKILENCILNGPLAGKTRVLVTHALHVLDKTDYIYVMDNGRIVEEGTFDTLMSDGLVFSKLMKEYGNLEQEEAERAAPDEKLAKIDEAAAAAPDKQKAALMQEEERVTGAVTWPIYMKYFRYAGGLLWAPTIALLLILNQGSQVANNIFLGFWTAQSIKGFDQADYMITYGFLGLANAIFTLFLSFTIALAALRGALNMFKAALKAVLRSPISFYDTTPMGRVMSRLSKDQDTLDTELSMIAFQLLNSFSSVIGTVALVFYTFPYLGIIFVPLTIAYYGFATYYRRTSVETKRLDSLMRSALYGAYSETLTGLSTVRGYGSQDRFIAKSAEGLDMENRAYFMTIAIQSWLGARLDFLGNVLVLGIALFAAGFRTSVNPSKIGVVLSYTLSITQTFSQLVSTYAQNEQNFNAVERVLHYTELPSEGAQTTPNDPPASWPEKGEVAFKNVEFAYREGLPLVLKGVTFTINPGEKVGIVGRTGAGKSSLLQALFRVVNVQGGAIEIDGRNIQDMGLDALRGRLALVPQDSTLFKGTLRENLDPQATRTDAELLSALQRAWLLPRDGTADPAADGKFSLDAIVSDDGSNYSAGEKQLLALCRALVRNSRIIVLDEATSNVDVETDAKLQRTIQTEFATSTLLCIAHRLNTIVYYDRVIVMDTGKVAEFDTPLNLFDREDSIFRALCNEAGISRQDIIRIRSNVPSS